MAKIEYLDGRYPFAADAAYEPGAVIIRPSGTVAIYDGLDGCAAGERISPQPIDPRPTVIWPAASADAWAAGVDLFHDPGTGNATTDSTGGKKKIGPSIDAKVAGATSIHIEAVAN